MINQEEIHRKSISSEAEERKEAVNQLRINFVNLSAKEQAWTDLIRLAQDEDLSVKWCAVESLGSSFPHLPNKEQAWADLHRLTQDEDRWVRVLALNSLGRALIFEATEAETEEIFREHLEIALSFFESAEQETIIPMIGPIDNPAPFCLPFYRAFYTIMFKKQEAEVEIQRYLAKAKSETEDSEGRENLLEALENLAEALREVQKVREMDFDRMKRDLNIYRRYCDRTAELLATTQEKAPMATRLIRKGLPIINRRIKELLNEIDKETKILCDAASDTKAENYVNPTCKEVREITAIRNPIELDKRIDVLIPNLIFMGENLPERERNFVNNKIENLKKEEYLEDKLSLINEIIVFAIPHISMSKDLERLENKLDDITISLEPGIREELTVTVGAKAFGTGIEHKITI
ncbi:MAG: HEAT repeat domain-containing protein, partial [Methanophagales archaeon]|nr:HEAT repeat domain-containing protein [Methanophagales archaeon]